MWEKFSEATQILRQNFILISAIILTVSLPANLLSNIFYYGNPEAGSLNSMRFDLFVEAIFSPLYTGALVYALYRLKTGNTVTYSEAIWVAVRNWLTLFTARLIAGMIVAVGFIALIVPGAILMVRYALIDEAVIVDNLGAHEARERSAKLVAGRGWNICYAAVGFHCAFILFTFLVYSPFEMIESNWLLPIEAGVDCLMDILYAIIQIVLFLFYWEAIEAPKTDEPLQPVDSSPSSQS